MTVTELPDKLRRPGTIALVDEDIAVRPLDNDDKENLDWKSFKMGTAVIIMEINSKSTYGLREQAKVMFPDATVAWVYIFDLSPRDIDI